MPRIARSIIPDIPYHALHRGNNRQKIFFSTADYRYFLSLIKEAKEKYPCRIYSYVLMPNHVHLIIESIRHAEHIAKFMKLVAQKYAQYFNWSRKRTGTLWEGRFKSMPVSSDEYLLACSRYIELNPVRAKIVSRPEDYRWSSLKYKIGESDDRGLVDADVVYAAMGRDVAERHMAYRRWIRQGIPHSELDTIRRTMAKGGVFGNGKFKEQIEGMLDRKIVMRERGRPKK